MESTGKIRHGWALLEVLGNLGYAVERYLLSCTNEVPDNMKSLICSAHRNFISAADAHYSNMSEDVVKRRMKDGIRDLEKVGLAIGKGENVPDELDFILKALYIIAKNNT